MNRPRISLVSGFRDPARRPRYIIWTGVSILLLAAVMIVALGVTSTRWFCAEGCHKVQDDTITAYQRSSHSEVSCMACHMPVGANPVVFILHKAEALGELYLTVTNNFELPLNGESEVALTMKSTQCTQCHDLSKRRVTATRGIIINHEVHAEADVSCAVCHNRIAHKEDFDLELKDPKTGERNRKHEVFMTMTACFRCHEQGGDAETPPGKCSACHPKNFDLKPASHKEPGFFPEGHGKMGDAEAKRVEEAHKSESEGASESFSEIVASRRQHGEGGDEEPIGELIPKTESINYCYTCHAKKFCEDCHGGLTMPHPAEFKKDHGETGRKLPQACARCHGNANTFCNECHHGSAMNWNYDAKTPWLRQHPSAVRATGAQACFDCHAPTFCADCHVNGPRD